MNDMSTPGPLSETLIDACVEAGLGVRGDSNGRDPYVADRYQTLLVDGVRRSVADAFLTPAVRARDNFTLVTGAHVNRVVIEEGAVVAAAVTPGPSPVA